MIYAERIVPGLNIFYSGHFQNTPNIKTFFGYPALIGFRERSLKMLQTGVEDILLGHETILWKYVGAFKKFCKNCWGIKPEKHTQFSCKLFVTDTKWKSSKYLEMFLFYLTRFINYVQYERGCVVQERICSTNRAHLQYERGCKVQASRSLSFVTGRHY